MLKELFHNLKEEGKHCPYTVPLGKIEKVALTILVTTEVCILRVM